MAPPHGQGADADADAVPPRGLGAGQEREAHLQRAVEEARLGAQKGEGELGELRQELQAERVQAAQHRVHAETARAELQKLKAQLQARL